MTSGAPIAEFRAIIPQIQSAVKISGGGDSRVQFDVAADDYPEVVKLAGFGRDKVLKVTVEVAELAEDAHS